MWYSFYSREVKWARSTVVESSGDNWENLAEKSVLVVGEWSLRCWENMIYTNIYIYPFIDTWLIFLCKGSADRDCVGNHCTRCRCRPFPQVLYLYLYCQVFRILRLEFSKIRWIRLLGEKWASSAIGIYICTCIFLFASVFLPVFVFVFVKVVYEKVGQWSVAATGGKCLLSTELWQPAAGTWSSGCTKWAMVSKDMMVSEYLVHCLSWCIWYFS